MRKIALVLPLVLAGAIAAAVPAHASTGQVYYETVPATGTTFIPACIPGPSDPTCDPRGPGSVLIDNGTLSYTQDGAVIGTISTRCTTTNETGGDYYAVCTDTLDTPSGTTTAVGYLDESAIERFQAQTIAVAGPPAGSLTIQQVVYPNVFQLTLN